MSKSKHKNELTNYELWQIGKFGNIAKEHKSFLSDEEYEELSQDDTLDYYEEFSEEKEVA
jgi:hypothetical protein